MLLPLAFLHGRDPRHGLVVLDDRELAPVGNDSVNHLEEAPGGFVGPDIRHEPHDGVPSHAVGWISPEGQAERVRRNDR